jgi:hypothetical protein
MVQDATKEGVLEHIGEIAGVKFVLVIHDGSSTTEAVIGRLADFMP